MQGRCGGMNVAETVTAAIVIVTVRLGSCLARLLSLPSFDWNINIFKAFLPTRTKTPIHCTVMSQVEFFSFEMEA